MLFILQVSILSEQIRDSEITSLAEDNDEVEGGQKNRRMMPYSFLTYLIYFPSSYVSLTNCCLWNEAH